VYSATKAALESSPARGQRPSAPTEIRVNSVAPRPTRTDAAIDTLGDGVAQMGSQTPLGRTRRPAARAMLLAVISGSRAWASRFFDLSSKSGVLLPVYGVRGLRSEFGCVLPTCRPFLIAIRLGSVRNTNQAQHHGERDEHLCRNQSDPYRSLPTGHGYVGHRLSRVIVPIDRDAIRVLLELYHRP
jgi:hypothetical protein